MSTTHSHDYTDELGTIYFYVVELVDGETELRPGFYFTFPEDGEPLEDPAAIDVGAVALAGPYDTHQGAADAASEFARNALRTYSVDDDEIDFEGDLPIGDIQIDADTDVSVEEIMEGEQL